MRARCALKLQDVLDLLDGRVRSNTFGVQGAVMSQEAGEPVVLGLGPSLYARRPNTSVLDLRWRRQNQGLGYDLSDVLNLTHASNTSNTLALEQAVACLLKSV